MEVQFQIQNKTAHIMFDTLLLRPQVVSSKQLAQEFSFPRISESTTGYTSFTSLGIDTR